MAGSSGSASEPADLKTKVKSLKQRGGKAEKTQAQKDAHNESCRKSRQKTKRRRVELEEMAVQHSEMRDENERMKMELQKIPGMENAIGELKKALEQKAANEELLLQMISILIGNGHNFTTFDELVVWFASQNYGQVGEGSDYTNLSPYAGAAVPFVANHYLNATNPNNNPFIRHSAAADNKAGFLAASAPGSSSVANHDLPRGFDGLNCDGNDNALVHHVLANGFLPASAADSSANHDLPDVSKSNDLFTPHRAADNQATYYHVSDHGFSLGGNPSSKAV